MEKAYYLSPPVASQYSVPRKQKKEESFAYHLLEKLLAKGCSEIHKYNQPETLWKLLSASDLRSWWWIFKQIGRQRTGIFEYFEIEQIFPEKKSFKISTS